MTEHHIALKQDKVPWQALYATAMRFAIMCYGVQPFWFQNLARLPGCLLRDFLRVWIQFAMWRFLSLIAIGASAVRSKHDDVAASLPEALWFDASAHVEKLQAYCVAWQGTRDLYPADMFSASQGLKKAFQRRGYRAKAFDINTSYKQDILSENGFYAAVDMIMSFLGGKMELAVWRFQTTPCHITHHYHITLV